MTAAWGKKLWDHRKMLGISRKRFAEMLDINEGTLRSYETEARKPGYQTFQKIENFLAESQKQKGESQEYMNELIRTKDKLIQSLERENELMSRLAGVRELPEENAFGEDAADIQFDFNIKINWVNLSIDVMYTEDIPHLTMMANELGYTLEEMKGFFQIDQYVAYTKHNIHQLRSEKSKAEMLSVVRTYLKAFKQIKENTTLLSAELPVHYTHKNGEVKIALVEYKVNWAKRTGSAHIRWMR